MANWKIEYIIYDTLLYLLALFIVPFTIIRNLCLRRPILPYFFNLSKKEANALSDKPVIWVQAVSMGEAIVAGSIIRELIKELPGYQVVLTTHTPTGYKIAHQKLPEVALITYFPLDFPFFIKRFVQRIQPKVFIMTESELWPNAVRYSKEFGAKVALVNGRISDRSFHNYLRFSKFVKAVFHQIDLFAMQSLEDADRVGKIGASAERVFVTGNAKFDQNYPSFKPEQLSAFREQYHISTEKLIFTAASTHRGEEEFVIKAFLELVNQKPFYLILAPRNPERAEEIGQLLEQSNLSYNRRSEEKVNPDSIVLLLDTFGELGLVYALADVVLVGGSLIKIPGIGGHNVLEAAVQEKPVLYGPYMNNFRESKRLLEEVDAGFTVYDSKDLVESVQNLLADRELYQRRAFNAKKVVLSNRGAAQNTANQIIKIIRQAELSKTKE